MFFKIMIFPNKLDYPRIFSILKHRRNTENQLYLNLIESSASAYFETDPITRYFFKKRFYVAGHLLDKKRFGQILDAGTGIGFFLPYLSTIADKVSAVDRLDSVLYTREMLKNRGIPNVTVDQYDLISLPYEESSFDLIVAFSVLDRFNPIETKIVINSFRRILKGGGLLLIGHSVENALVRLLHHRMSFLFGGRRRTRQALEVNDPLKVILHPYVKKVADIHKMISDFGFSKEFSKNISIINLMKLYNVAVFKNQKSIKP